MDIPKTYDQSKEADVYKLWESSGYFNPDNLTGEPFTIIMPPPNANGLIHLGHAAFVTPEDIMIRYQRMQGRKTLWVPGTDHAGFETQVVFEKKLEKQGRSRFKMSREEFYKEVWDFVQKYKTATEEGLKSLGASCDWTRNMFTLDPRIIKIVYETFKKMYEDGLVYRGNRICNWCPKHQTGLADLETVYEERIDPLYYIRYGPFTLATVRPETKFGDTAIAVHPNDKRYQKLLDKEIEVVGLLGKFKMKVVGDDVVDKNFGTGVIKVTPAHDAVDFEIWQRHKDEIPGPKQVIDKRGRMDLPGTKYHGLKVAEARKMVVEDLQKAGLVEKIEANYKHNVALCYKCKNVIEPLIVPQWYVAMTKPFSHPRESGDLTQARSLRDMAVAAVKTKKIKIIPSRFEKVFMHWMNNIRDWPISRQIWWGIPIPAWYKDGEIKISIEKPGDDWTADPDTFDTWFSSGQWPYAALKSNSEKDLETFYPTDVMETGWEILFFWVARMIMFGLYLTDKVPFRTIYLHGILRDKEGQKMSKSKGNVTDPKIMTQRYGVDALRMAITVGNVPGVDSSLSEDKIRGYRNFANKIWNAARFVLQNTHDLPSGVIPAKAPASTRVERGEGIQTSGSRIKLAPDSDPVSGMTKEDQAILKNLDKFAKAVTTKLDKFDFAHAAEDLYHFFWHTFADKIIEESKPKLADPKKRASAQLMLQTMLETQLKLLHPFMPFVTETIWQLNHKDLLMIQKWPTGSINK